MRALRLMTYNIRQCITARSRGAVDRVAAVIAAAGADVVALQEVDVKRARTAFVDQAAALGEALGMQSHFVPAMIGPIRSVTDPPLPLDAPLDDAYGNAILSRHPFRVVAGGLLPKLPERPLREPRGALWVAIAVGGREVQVIATHLGLSRRERHLQLDALLGPSWLGDPRCRGPRVLCGDLNCLPGSSEHRRAIAVLRDAVAIAPPAQRRRATFPSRLPVIRLDHILVSRDIAVRHTEIPRRADLRRVSDHLPLVADLELVDEAADTVVDSGWRTSGDAAPASSAPA